MKKTNLSKKSLISLGLLLSLNAAVFGAMTDTNSALITATPKPIFIADKLQQLDSALKQVINQNHTVVDDALLAPLRSNLDLVLGPAGVLAPLQTIIVTYVGYDIKTADINQQNLIVIYHRLQELLKQQNRNPQQPLLYLLIGKLIIEPGPMTVPGAVDTKTAMTAPHSSPSSQAKRRQLRTYQPDASQRDRRLPIRTAKPIHPLQNLFGMLQKTLDDYNLVSVACADLIPVQGLQVLYVVLQKKIMTINLCASASDQPLNDRTNKFASLVMEEIAVNEKLGAQLDNTDQRKQLIAQYLQNKQAIANDNPEAAEVPIIGLPIYASENNDPSSSTTTSTAIADAPTTATAQIPDNATNACCVIL